MNERCRTPIEIENLDFSYPAGGFRLRIAGMSLNRCNKTAVLGPSGCGKSTLLKLLAGIVVPRSGSIIIDDINIAGLTDAARRDFRSRRVGFIFQQFELIDYLPLLENVLLPLRLRPGVRIDARSRTRAAQLLEAAGLSGKFNRMPARLSHGERQRVAIARAMINQPELILADEPTGNLDTDNKKVIRDLIFKSAEADSATLIFITHDHNLLDGFDKVIDLEQLLREGDNG